MHFFKNLQRNQGMAIISKHTVLRNMFEIQSIVFIKNDYNLQFLSIYIKVYLNHIRKYSLVSG